MRDKHDSASQDVSQPASRPSLAEEQQRAFEEDRRRGRAEPPERPFGALSYLFRN